MSVFRVPLQLLIVNNLARLLDWRDFVRFWGKSQYQALPPERHLPGYKLVVAQGNPKPLELKLAYFKEKHFGHQDFLTFSKIGLFLERFFSKTGVFPTFPSGSSPSFSENRCSAKEVRERLRLRLGNPGQRRRGERFGAVWDGGVSWAKCFF